MKFVRQASILVLIGFSFGHFVEAINLPDGPTLKKPKPILIQGEYKEPEILQAIRSNDFAKVKDLIENKRVDINARYSDYIDPRARFAMDPNINKRDGYTALIEASRVNNTDIAKYLIGKGADVNVVASKNYGKETITALDYARRNNNVEMINVLEGKSGAQKKPQASMPIKKNGLDAMEDRANKIENEIKTKVTPEIKKEIAEMLAEVKQIEGSRPMAKMLPGPAADAWIAEGRKIRNLREKLENLNKQVQ